MGHIVGGKFTGIPAYDVYREQAEACINRCAMGGLDPTVRGDTRTPSLTESRMAGNSPQHFRYHAWAYVGRAPADMTMAEFRSLFALEGEALAQMAATDKIDAPSKASIDALFTTEEDPPNANADA